MFRLFLVSVLVSLCGARSVYPKDDDPLQLVKEIIYEANQEIANKSMSELDLGKVEVSEFYLLHAGAKGLRVGRLDTLALVGDEQSFTEQDVDNATVFKFDLVLGLTEAHASAGLFVQLLMEWETPVGLKVSGEGVRAVGSVRLEDDLTSCSLSLDSVSVKNLGKVEVDLKPNGAVQGLLQVAINLGANYILPRYLDTINKYVDALAKDFIPKYAHDLVCSHIM